MSEQAMVTQDERLMAGLAHGSIFFSIFTGGLGGIVTALAIWLIQKEKSAYVAGQAFQALIYQVLTFLVTTVAWCCWGMLWMALLFTPLIGNPERYEAAPPPGLWVGLGLLIVPLALWGVSLLYGLWGAARALGGHPFKYAIIGNWLESQNR
jgi:hypothetical protein